MTVSWFSGLLLLSALTLRASRGDKCVVGVFGEATILPCVYNGVKNLTALNVSSEWRTGTEMMLRREWTEGEEVLDAFPTGRMTVSSTAPQSGDFSVVISDLHLSDSHNYSQYLQIQGQNQSLLLCSVCLTVAARFTEPILSREDTKEGEPAKFICHSRGGFPEPGVYWFIDHTQRPPVEAVGTHIVKLPASELLNVTSVLTETVSEDTVVSCVIENQVLNETLSVTSGVLVSTVVGRASQAMSMFSTGLCVVVGVLVAIALAYQIKGDRLRRRGRQTHAESDSEDTEMIVVNFEQLKSLPETDV
ncbi:ICOS ligand-like [Chanos chanos]|uniref:ICOS ligand-like n=1 Tax=Chanos chanos TaxID=29144 RepID=A0A6J2WRZ6_CHACN|nr:ICOS ligand-like [Chanos chanos]